MNIQKLMESEGKFLLLYPEGFKSSDLADMSKKHNFSRLVERAQEDLTPERLRLPEANESIIKVATRSSMVSMFEKPKFRDAIRAMDDIEKVILREALMDMLYGDEESGFNSLLMLLTSRKLAKWTLMTVFRCYCYPETDFLLKPTTTKMIIAKYEIEGLVYSPRPTYDFYNRYRDAVHEMKSLVNPSLAPSDAEFLGFLMMADKLEV